MRWLPCLSLLCLPAVACGPDGRSQENVAEDPGVSVSEVTGEAQGEMRVSDRPIDLLDRTAFNVLVLACTYPAAVTCIENQCGGRG